MILGNSMVTLEASSAFVGSNCRGLFCPFDPLILKNYSGFKYLYFQNDFKIFSSFKHKVM